MSDDIKKSKAASRYRKACKELEAAMEERAAVPAPAPNEPKHQAARRARAAQKVAAASIRLAQASLEELDANLSPAPIHAKPKSKL